MKFLASNNYVTIYFAWILNGLSHDKKLRHKTVNCYAGLANTSLAVAITVASSHFAYPWTDD